MLDAFVIAGSIVWAYLVGSVPFSFFVTRVVSGVDLRQVGTGTVSGSGVGEASGFWPMALAGLLDIGKGALAVLPVAGSRPVTAALAAGLAVVGHNWSPWLRSAGGRGISPAIGAAAVLAWVGAIVLLAGLAAGKAAGYTSVGSFLSQAALPGVLAVAYGTPGVVLGVAVVLPMWAKRVTGNRRPAQPSARGYVYRLLRDHDPPRSGGGPE